MPKKVHFGEFLKAWSLRSNSVTRQVTFNRTKIGGKCQNSIIQMRHFGWFSNIVYFIKNRVGFLNCCFSISNAFVFVLPPKVPFILIPHIFLYISRILSKSTSFSIHKLIACVKGKWKNVASLFSRKSSVSNFSETSNYVLKMWHLKVTESNLEIFEF